MISKFSVAVAVVVGLASSVLAEGFFVGGQLGINFKPVKAEENAKINYSGTYYTEGDSKIAPFMGVKFGYDFDLWRAYGAFNYNSGTDYEYSSRTTTQYQNFEIDNESLDFVIGADWTPEINSKFKIVVGPYAGYSVLNTDMSYTNSTSGIISEFERTIRQNGFVYGGKIGGIITFARHHEIDFGVKYDTVKYGDKDDIIVSSDISMNMKGIKRNSVGLYAGYNFKF